MLNDWIFIGVFLILAPIFPAAALLVPRLIAPRKPNSLKSETYECGIETYGETWVQFKAQYYIFALVFLIFDIEVYSYIPGLWHLINFQCSQFLKVSSLS